MERDRFRYCELNAYYGGLLTKKQSEIFSLHYEEDYSLAEIAEKFNITRQAVLDNLRKAEKVLDNAEQKIGLVARDNLLRQHLFRVFREEERIRYDTGRTSGQAVRRCRLRP